MIRSLLPLALVLCIGLGATYAQDGAAQHKPTTAARTSDAALFNVYFANNFQDDTPGKYLDREWKYDWYGRYGLGYPGWSSRQVPPRIQRDASNPSNKVMRWTFPKGSRGPDEGGGQWEVRFDHPFDDIYFSYRIKFKPGFQWNIGGKIPGLGINYKHDKAHGDLTASLMFKEKGNIVFYPYHLDQRGHYGDTLRWGYQMPAGKWINIAIHVKMNTVGKANGVLEGYIDGKFIKRFTTLRWRDASTANAGVDFMKIYTFFGGATRNWASPVDQWLEVDDFVLFDFKPGVKPLDSDGRLRIPKAAPIRSRGKKR